jgi:hypothetical protein
MTATISEYRFRSAQSKLDFLESEVASWQNPLGLESQDFLADINQLYVDILQLDNNLQEAYFDGLPYSEELSGAVHSIATKWFLLAKRIDFNTSDINEELTCLQKNLREAEAFLNPSTEMSEAMCELRDQAVVEHRNHLTLEGLVD